MLSSILDSTFKTQDKILPCQLKSTLHNLRSRSNVQFSCKCLLILYCLSQFSLYDSQYCYYALAIFIPIQAHLLLHLLLALLLLIIILTTLLDLLILVIIFPLSITTYKVFLINLTHWKLNFLNLIFWLLRRHG